MLRHGQTGSLRAKRAPYLTAHMLLKGTSPGLLELQLSPESFTPVPAILGQEA